MDALKPFFAKVMPFVGFTKAEAESKGRAVLSTTAPFDELSVLKVRVWDACIASCVQDNAEFIRKSLKLTEVTLFDVSEAPDAKVPARMWCARLTGTDGRGLHAAEADIHLLGVARRSR